MPLVRLIYISQATNAEDLDIGALVENANANNAKTGITGMLWFNGVYFIQLLEGERETVNKTYHSIIQDSRHTDFHLIAFDNIIDRDFPGWSMGYFSDLIKNVVSVKRFNLPDTYKPALITAESALGMLRAVLDSTDTEQ